DLNPRRWECRIRRLICLLCLLSMVFALSCKGRKEVLRIGIISPSVNHFPLSYAVHKGMIDTDAIEIIGFSAGWELQEAIIAGKIDSAIMPFTYAWNTAAKGYPIRIVSFFERETDAIVVADNIAKPEDLNGAKVGLIKASTLDVFFIEWAQRNNIKFEPVYFRTPNEMIAALQSGSVPAIVCYEPLIRKLVDKFQVLHWFGDDYPHHPCCDLVVNTDRLDKKRKAVLVKLLAALQKPVEDVNLGDPEALAYMGKTYGLSHEQCVNTLSHTVFTIGLGWQGRDFERRMAEISLQQGYIDRMLRDDDIYLILE
ncbi:MAG: ABC transporter substrate-binding protein, partial [Candidatus Cloacimonadaceae bacterium]|nr:ABC transporter substrate-binding protein [Candidatus Cloacimonadaceae bacterium]